MAEISFDVRAKLGAFRPALAGQTYSTKKPNRCYICAMLDFPVSPSQAGRKCPDVG